MDALAVTFREGIEAVLVVGIMIAFLERLVSRIWFATR